MMYLAALQARGYKVTLSGDALSFTVEPKDKLNQKMRELILQYRNDILEELREQQLSSAVVQNDPALKMAVLLRDRGWVRLYSHVLGQEVIFKSSQSVEVPEEYAQHTSYTYDELAVIWEEDYTVDHLRAIHDTKTIFNGYVIPDQWKGSGVDGSGEQYRLVPCGSGE